MLRATGLTRRHVLDDVTVEVRAGRGRRAGRPARIRPDARPRRPSTVRSRSTAARWRSAGEPVQPGSPRAAIAAGIALIPEDRKAEGIIPTLSVRDNIVLAALPALSARASSRERQQDVIVEAPDAPAADQGLRAPTSGSASCPAATSRRCCWPGCCASSRECCSSTTRPAASTSARRPRSRRSISELAGARAGGRADLLRAGGGRRGLGHGSSSCETEPSSARCPAPRSPRTACWADRGGSAAGGGAGVGPRRRAADRGATTMSSAELTADRPSVSRDEVLDWIAERGVYVGLLAADRLQPRLHAAVRRDRQHPPAVRAGRPGGHHRARDGARHRHPGHRPLGRLGHGDRLRPAGALPGLRTGRGDHDRADRRRVRRRGQRHADLALRDPAHRRDAGAARRRSRSRARDRPGPADRDLRPDS